MFIDSVPYSQLLCLPGGKKLAHGESNGSSLTVVPPLLGFLICTAPVILAAVQVAVSNARCVSLGLGPSFLLICVVFGRAAELQMAVQEKLGSVKCTTML